MRRLSVISVITLAFISDPIARWAIPDAVRYLAAMPPLVGAFGGNGFASQTIHLAEGGMGAAVWLSGH